MPKDDPISFAELLAAAERFHRDGAPVPARPAARLRCVWSREPELRPLESHWVTEPPEAA